MRRIIFGLLGLISSSALANETDFPICDGYRAPGKSADGITSEGILFGLVSQTSDVRRHQTKFGTPGVSACDRALADPLLQSRFWVRRAHLLQAKAMHLLVDRDFESSIRTLAESDTVIASGNDPLVGGSIGLGNRALRSLALVNLSRRQDAEAELERIKGSRPFAAAVRQMVRTIRLSGPAKMEEVIALLRVDAPLEPGLLRPLFWVYMAYARFEEAVALYPEISLDIPRGQNERDISGLKQRRYKEISDRAELAGALAYALTALGKSQEAMKVIESVGKEIDDGTRPPPPPPNGKAMSRSVKADYTERVAAGDVARGNLKLWQAAIALRETASGMSMLELANAIGGKRIGELPIVTDLVGRTKKFNPEESAAAELVARQFHDRLERQIQANLRMTFEEMAEVLPRPETARNTVRFQSGLALVLLGNSGVTIKKSDAPGELSITYEAASGTKIMTDELSLLAAAMQAKKAGKNSFLVQSKLNVIRTMTACGYICSGAIPNGYETRISILPVDSATWPEDRRWRLINAQRVYDELASKYLGSVAK